VEPRVIEGVAPIQIHNRNESTGRMPPFSHIPLSDPGQYAQFTYRERHSSYGQQRQNVPQHTLPELIPVVAFRKNPSMLAGSAFIS
jgi:hypothetical protein